MVKLVVGNLPPSATNQSLKEIFHEYQDLQDYKLISNYGFVYLESETSANHAVTKLNGIEYRGFQITVDFVGDSRAKRRLPVSGEAATFPKPSAQPQKRFPAPLMEQRNPNPYNLNYSNENRLPDNNGVTRSFDSLSERRYGTSINEARNPNPYNLPFAKSNVAPTRPYDMIPDKRYGVAPSFDDFQQPSIYGSHSFEDYQKPMYGSQSFDDYQKAMYVPPSYQSSGYGAPRDEQYAVSGFYNDYNDQYAPDEEYYSSVGPVKRFKPTTLLEDHRGYGYVRRKPVDTVEDEFRSFRVGAQPSWYETRQAPMRSSFLHGEDESNYYPRGKRVYQPKKSYIDEYEDDRDYSDVDPYPAYLKQYRK